MNNLRVYTKACKDGTYEVFYSWKMGFCEGCITVDVQDIKLQNNHEEAAEMSAVAELVKARKNNLSKTGKGLRVFVSCFEILGLQEAASENAYLGNYAQFLATQYIDALIEWSTDCEWIANKTEQYQEFSLKITAPPIVKTPCTLLGEEVVITRHAMQRAVERSTSFTSLSKAYLALVEIMADPELKEQEQTAMRQMHNDLVYNKKSRSLWHPRTNLLFTLIQEDFGWVVVTCVQYFQGSSYR